MQGHFKALIFIHLIWANIALAEVKCYDLDKVLNFLCYRICVSRDFDLGRYDKSVEDCVCEDKPYRYQVTEVIFILPPVHTNLTGE